MSIREALVRVFVKPDHSYTCNEIPNLEDLKNDSLAPKLAAWLELVEKKHLAQLAENVKTNKRNKETVKEKTPEQPTNNKEVYKAKNTKPLDIEIGE